MVKINVTVNHNYSVAGVHVNSQIDALFTSTGV